MSLCNLHLYNPIGFVAPDDLERGEQAGHTCTEGQVSMNNGNASSKKKLAGSERGKKVTLQLTPKDEETKNAMHASKLNPRMDLVCK